MDQTGRFYVIARIYRTSSVGKVIRVSSFPKANTARMDLFKDTKYINVGIVEADHYSEAIACYLEWMQSHEWNNVIDQPDNKNINICDQI